MTTSASSGSSAAKSPEKSFVTSKVPKTSVTSFVTTSATVVSSPIVTSTGCSCAAPPFTVQLMAPHSTLGGVPVGVPSSRVTTVPVGSVGPVARNPFAWLSVSVPSTVAPVSRST